MVILVLFVILEGMLSAFHHDYNIKYCFVIHGLCYVEAYSLFAPFLEYFFLNHKQILNFVKSFVLAIEMTMIFILQFVNVVYHTDQFADIEKSLQL